MNQSISLLRSKLKVEILQKLHDENLTPIMLAKVLKKPRASVSRAILELAELKYVKCINNEKDRWRFYQITSKGKDALKQVKKYL